MSMVDKKSVREEVSHLKADFEILCATGKISIEAEAMMKSILIIMDLILAIFLERNTKKNNKNSSIPSSQTGKDETSTNQSGSNGKGKQTEDETINNHRTVETVRIEEVEFCDKCGEFLKDEPCLHYERRTKIDIIFEKTVEHVDVEIKNCPSCNNLAKAPFPKDMPGPLQYGNGLKAFVINLLICQMVSLNRVQGLIKSMIGRVISEATFLKFILRLYEALELWEKEKIDEIMKKQAIHVDETSLRVNKKNHWIHVYSSGDITLKFLHKSRGKPAIEAISIIPNYKGIIIHDCWSSYLSYTHCGHGLCGSHLLRELTFIVDSNGYSWAKNMKRLLLESCKKVAIYKDKKLSDKEIANLQKRYRNILTRGSKELPPRPIRPTGKRGRLAQSDAQNLFDRLKKYETAVLLFTKNSHVSFTNNRAERDLRMSKVKQKVSGCFRVEIYAKAYCRISSYLQTMSNLGHNPLIAIQMALATKGRE